jgi:hypothetical protein
MNASLFSKSGNSFLTSVLSVLFLVQIECQARPDQSDPHTAIVSPSRQTGAMSSEEISAKMAQLAKNHAQIQVVRIGRSAGNKALEALLVGDFAIPPDGQNRPLTFRLIGTPHGLEPSEEMVSDQGAAHYLQLGNKRLPGSARYVIFPNVNPDGRDLNRRRNAAGVNLSIDFVSLSQPETRAIVELLKQWKPDVLLDVHESAAFKKSTLGAKGYLIHFDAQFEPANNPNIAKDIQELSFSTILPEAISRTKANNLPAQRYISEITSVDQVLVHGGLSLRNLRNYAGMRGTVSFLLENRLDPSFGTYDTPRNIGERVRRQYISISSFIDTCLDHRKRIREVVEKAASWEAVQASMLFGEASYSSIPGKHEVVIQLRRLDSGELENHVFMYKGHINAQKPLPEVDGYLITGQIEEIALLLSRHGIEFTRNELGLMVSTWQPAGRQIERLTAMLLDQDSSTSIWRTETIMPGLAKSQPVQQGIQLIPLK